MNTCLSPCTPVLLVVDRIKMADPTLVNKTELEMYTIRRSTLVAIRYTHAGFILDCNVILGFTSSL